jgi:hypothetical protein
VVVKSALAHPGSLADVCHAGGVVASFGEEVHGGFQDVLARFFTAMLHGDSS